MITAREAIALTQESLLRLAYEKIEATAKSGQSACFCNMDSHVMDQLLSNGFVVKDGWIGWKDT